uniref:Uncharacterized protein LOC104224352 isoform X3 n=1 Tax=Nicotiana sylvestris TaxID=4096 RepID=A0A1U7W6P2_NICSY|nr:PREDICTED: uncharacterized protein LOC104224352 isoform X3 [Nicotiana sylvestris]
MAVLNYCYLSVTSVATPISQDSANNSTPSSILTQTKVILPQQKPVKLSNGDVATTTKLRKYWGEDVDPLTSDDYIWNKEFMGRMKKYIQDPQQHAPSSPSAPVKMARTRCKHVIFALRAIAPKENKNSNKWFRCTMFEFS